MKTSNNLPKLIEINKPIRLKRKLDSLKLTNEIKVKFYPTYKVELILDENLYKTFRISGHVISIDGKSYRVKENIEEYIDKLK